MKYIITSLSLFLVLACGDTKNTSVEDVIASNDLEKIRNKKVSLDQEQQEIASQLKLLEAKIKELDPLQKIPLITTIKVKDTLFDHYVELQGSVTTKQNVVISAEYGGVLRKVYAKEGQKVGKGDILAKIDDGGLSQQLAQLKIQTDLAKTTYERQKRLWEQNIGSEIQYLQAKTAYETQQEATNQLAQQLAKTVVRAPFSGTIDDVITDEGSVVSPGQSPLFRIVSLTDMYIETDVPESYITTINEGKAVEVQLPVIGKTINTKVSQASDFINPANRTFKIQVPLSNKDKLIKPNLTAKLRINDYTNKEAILIPQSIISENANGEQYVYIITDKQDSVAKSKRVIIQTGKTQGDYIEVLSGLESGDEIIDEGARSVKDGQEVKILDYQA